MNSIGKLFFILCLLGVVQAGTSAQDRAAEAHGGWKMALLKKSGSVYESLPFGQSLTMTRRDSYQLYLAFNIHAFCYVIQEDDEGGLPFVFSKTVSPGDSISLPEENRDFIAAEQPGTNRFYVIVSADHKNNLERLIGQYEREPGAVSLERSLLSEVLAIRRNVPSHPDPAEATPAETDRIMSGPLRFFEGRDDWVVTVTVRN